MGAYSGNFTASLVSDITSETLASVSFAASSVAGDWTRQDFTLVPTASASDVNNSFTLTFDASSGDVLNFNLISLFPPTYNDRPNGNRKDLMESLAALNGKHFRIPGGNNLEGNSAPDRWVWNLTLGDLTQRPGRPGTWGYDNTDGLGLIEYLLWCQDLNIEPVLAVWSGLYLDGTIVPEDELAPYVQDALNELELLMGDASTTYGAQRIALGYTDPFPIKFVEVGNEDNLNGGTDSYTAYRFPMFYGTWPQKQGHCVPPININWENRCDLGRLPRHPHLYLPGGPGLHIRGVWPRLPRIHAPQLLCDPVQLLRQRARGQPHPGRRVRRHPEQHG